MSSLDDIINLMESGEYKKAIDELNVIISNEPNNAKAFYMRGKSLFLSIQNDIYQNTKYDAQMALAYSNIEKDLKKALEINPNIIDAYRGLMYLYRLLNDIDKERYYAQILLELSDSYNDALIILASSYLNNGITEADFHQAIGFYDDFIENSSLEESKIARFERGLCYYNLNILAKSDLEANNLIIDFPMYDDAYFLKGITLAKQGVENEFFDEAIYFFDRAISINPKNFNAIYERAEWYFYKKKYKEAIENYNILINHNKNKYVMEALLGKTQALHDFIVEGGNYLENDESKYKDLQEALNLIDKVVNLLGDKSLQYRYYKSNLYAHNGEIDKARKEYDNILEEADNISTWFYEVLAEFYYNYAESNDDYKKALFYLDKISKQERKSSTFKLMIFLNYELKNYSKITDICREFFDSFGFENDNHIEDSYYVNFIYAHSLQMINHNDFDEIIKHYKLCLNSKTLDKALIYRNISKIMIYSNPKEFKTEGVSYLKNAMELKDAFSYYIYSKELFYGNVVEPCPEIAISFANTAIEMDYKLDCAYVIMGRAYELGRGVVLDSDKAFELYYKAYKISEMNSHKCSCSTAALAHCYYNGIGVEENKSLAMSVIKNIVDKRGKYSHIYVLLLYSYFALNNYNGFSVSKALSLFNTSYPYYSDLSVVMTLKRLYKRLGKKEDIKRMSKMELDTLENTGEFNLSYFKKYIKNFNNYYPIVHIIK